MQLTSMIRHGRSMGSIPAYFAMKANLACFAPQGTGWPFLAAPSHPEAFGCSPVLSDQWRSQAHFRGSAISRSRSDWAAGFSGLRRSYCIQRLSVEKPIPKPVATCLRGKPLVNATRTASARNSSVGCDAICVLLCDTSRGQRSGTIPRQVQLEGAAGHSAGPQARSIRS